MRYLFAALAMLLAQGVFAAPKSCVELKQEIEIKIQARGVLSYTLEIVPVADVTDPSMVVGSCENGTKRIIYQRNDG